MFEIDIEGSFSSAHSLKGYQGNCSFVHGHNWTVIAYVQAERLDAVGIAMDFRKLKTELNDILQTFDHKNLNELPEFQAANPTSELLAKIIFERLAAKIDGGDARVSKVRVKESPGSGASYFVS